FRSKAAAERSLRPTRETGSERRGYPPARPLHTLRDVTRQLNTPQGVAPLVVVPRQHLHEPLLDDERRERVHDRARWVSDVINAHQRLFRDSEDALEVGPRRLAEREIGRAHV